jgi:hypothetical protein
LPSFGTGTSVSRTTCTSTSEPVGRSSLAGLPTVDPEKYAPWYPS